MGQRVCSLFSVFCALCSTHGDKWIHHQAQDAARSLSHLENRPLLYFCLSPSHATSFCVRRSPSFASLSLVMDASTSHEPPQRLSLGQPIPMTAHVVPAAGTASTSSGSAAASTGTAAAAGAASSSSSSSLINPTSLALSLPHSAHSVPVPLVDAQALHYLTLEMSHALRASAQRSARRRRRGLAMMQEAGFDVDPVDFAASSDASQQQQQQGVQTLEDSDGDETEVIKRLEAIGSHVGATFAER